MIVKIKILMNNRYGDVLSEIETINMIQESTLYKSENKKE